MRYGKDSILSAFILVLTILAVQMDGIADERAKDPGSGWLIIERAVVFAAQSVELSFQDEGTIASLDVRKNQRVSLGQVLGKLDSEIAESEKRIAGNQAQMALEEAKDDGEALLAERIVEFAKWEADQHETLVSKGSAAWSDSPKKKLAVKQAELSLSKSISAKATRVLKSQLAQEAVKLCQHKLDRLSLRSPIEGNVDSVDHQAGEWVRPGMAILKVVRLDEVRADFLVNLDQFPPNQLVGKKIDAILKIGATESTFSGRITSYDQEVSSSGQVRVHATVQNQKAIDKTNQREKQHQRNGEDWLLLPGMNISMRLQKP